jgi:type VI secretion system protein ImpC
MDYAVSFGTITSKPRARTPGQTFRLAIMGDFSGRANAGKLETGAQLAKRKPIKVDVDNLDDVLERMKLELTLILDGGEGIVTLTPTSMDDFHPDQIAENTELFTELRTLRRNLGSKAGADRAAKQILSWSGEAALPPLPRKSASATIATDRKISDFARLTGRKSTTDAADTATDALIRRLVGPLIQPARDSRADQLTARVDEALSLTMNRILHHPDFQSAEATWRGVEFLVRRIETGARMQIILYDVSAEELAADLAASDKLDESGLYGMLVEQPALDADQGAISAVIGLYGFELTPPHADLLGRIAQVAASAQAPFITGIGPDALSTPMHEQHPLIRAAWTSLRDLEAAAYLGLAAPRFLLRMPYGKKSDPIDAFGFEEFSRQSGLSGMLWGHPALIPALLLAESFGRQGMKLQLGSILTVRDMVSYIYFDKDGDQIALPCTERLYTERQAQAVGEFGVMPLLSLRGRPELRLGGFGAVRKGSQIAGFWGQVTVTPPGATASKPAPTPAPTPAPQAAAAPPPPTTPPITPSAPPPPPPADDTADLDALLASLSAPTPEPEPAAAAAEPAMDDLDALLASLNVEPLPPAADSTDADLDALLASLQ